MCPPTATSWPRLHLVGYNFKHKQSDIIHCSGCFFSSLFLFSISAHYNYIYSYILDIMSITVWGALKHSVSIIVIKFLIYFFNVGQLCSYVHHVIKYIPYNTAPPTGGLHWSFIVPGVLYVAMKNSIKILNGNYMSTRPLKINIYWTKRSIDQSTVLFLAHRAVPFQNQSLVSIYSLCRSIECIRPADVGKISVKNVDHLGGLDRTVRMFSSERPPLVCRGHEHALRDLRVVCGNTKG